MQAIVYRRYGSPNVLKLKEVEKPVPKEDELLIRVAAASINARDWRMLRARPFFIRFMVGGLLKPKIPILGADVSGTVEAVGGSVRQFQPGEQVFGYLSRYGGRTLAEYVCATEAEIAPKPANLSWAQAAVVPLAAMTALQGLRDKGQLQPGQQVLIQGASGGVGSFAVQIARVLGAEVTAVCSPRNLEMAHTLGAEHVIDYTKENFTRKGQRYDLILAVNGYHPISDYLRAVRPGGRYVVAGGSMLQFVQAALRGQKTAGSGQVNTAVISLEHNQKDLLYLKELLESGRLVPVIDDCYPLEKTAEAFRYFEKVHPQGKLAIRLEQNC